MAVTVVFGADANAHVFSFLFAVLFVFLLSIRCTCLPPSPPPGVLSSGERRQQHEQRLFSFPERPLLYFQRADRLHPRFDARARIGRPAALCARG